jgi:hypothetical protein
MFLLGLWKEKEQEKSINGEHETKIKRCKRSNGSSCPSRRWKRKNVLATCICKRDFERIMGGGKGKKRKRYPALIIRTTRRHPNNLDKSRITLGMTTGLYPRL